jgi:carboxyl-terminal processing protease
MGVVVLINQGSASASEIVSGALQAHDAALVLGERSFGKGSVQTVHPTAANARLKLTTQYYRLPASDADVAAGRKGRLVHKRPGEPVWGVDPGILVKMTPQQAVEALELRQKADALPQDEEGNVDPSPDKRPDVMTLLTEGIDPQLETAVLILQARALGALAGETQHAAREGEEPGG